MLVKSMKRKLIILALMFFVILSVSAVSASDNVTDEEILTDDGDYDAEIINAEDYTAEYESNNQLRFDLISYDGVYGDVRFDMVDNNTGKSIGVAYYLEDEDCGYGFVEKGVGKYCVTLKALGFSDTPYKIKPVTFNVKIIKAPVKLTAKKWVTTTKEYATLKVIVKNKYNCKISEGTVKFSINGKTYDAKVNNGVATKKIKLSKAKTYTYRATFTSKNYKSKTVSSKIYVKKAKKYYSFKANKYSGKITYKNYIQLINAKNNGRSKCIHLVVGMYLGRYPIHMYIETFHIDGQYPKGDYVNVWIDNGMGMDGPHFTKKVNLYTLNP